MAIGVSLAAVRAGVPVLAGGLGRMVSSPPMRRLSCLAVLALASACATSGTAVAPAPTPEAPPAPPPAAASAPAPKPSMVYRYEGIELFGSRRYPKEELLAPYLAGLPPVGTELDMAKDGDAFIQALTRGKEVLVSRYGMVLVRNSVGAMAADRTMSVTVDVVDQGDAWRLQYDPEPTGSVEEPEGLLTAWSTYSKRMWQLVNSGEVSVQETTPCRAFHCFYGPGHPELMRLEEPLLAGVPRHFATLVQMLRTDKDPAKREQAAYLLAYGRSREEVAAALVPAMSDAHEAPRNAAMRVLWVLQAGADRPLVPLDKALRALQGPLISDRNKAAGLLAEVLKKDPSQRARVVREAGDVLLEMASMRRPDNLDRISARLVFTAMAGRELGEDLPTLRAWMRDVLAAPSR